jgi:DNA-directed RNA polymerase omega subunit
LITPGLEANSNLGSRYDIVLLAAQRAKQLQEGSAPLIRTKSTHPLTIALEEIQAGAYPPPEKEETAVKDLDEEFIGAALAEQDLKDISSRFEASSIPADSSEEEETLGAAATSDGEDAEE